MSNMLRYLAGGLIAVALLAAFLPSQDPIIYHEVVIPAARILEREVPGEVRLRDRIVYSYKIPEITAIAPAGAKLQVQTFCAPTVALALGDTTSRPARREVVRSVVSGHSWIPLRPDPLMVSSMDNYGDLFARDYHVRPGFGVGSGDSIVVRNSRFAFLGELAEHLIFYGALRALEATVH